MCNKKLLLTIILILTSIISVMFCYNLIQNKTVGFLWMNRNNWQWKDNWSRVNPVDVVPELKKLEIVPIPKIEKEQPNQSESLVLSYEDALTKSRETNKPVLLIFGADWCKYCQRMKSETLNKDKVKECLKNYIVLNIDVDKDPSITNKMNVKILPSYIITNYDKNILKRSKGFMDLDSFCNWLNSK